MIIVAAMHAALAADASISLDLTELHEGQSVGFSLVVKDAAPLSVPDLDLPDGLEARFQSQSKARTIINFESSVATTFRYTLTASRRGTYTLGPFSVATREGTLRTPPRTLSVGARLTGGTDALATELTASRAWVGQVLVHHMRFLTDRALVSASWNPATGEGLSPEPTVEPVAREARLEEDGKPMAMQELFVPLRAVSAGKRTVSGGVLQAQFAVSRPRNGSSDLLFGDLARFRDVRNEVFAGEPVKVEVQDLPAKGRPADFSGLIGTFTLVGEASGDTLAVGETLTTTITLEGDGVLAGHALAPAKVDGFRVYDDQPVVTASLDEHGYHAKAVYKRAYVPQAPGAFTLPPLTLSVFDPAAAAYRTLETSPVQVTVSGSADSARVASFTTPQKAEVSAQGEDILPMRTQASVNRPLSPWWSLLAWVPALVLGGGGAVGALRSRLARGRGARRRLGGVDVLPVEREARLAGWDALLRERVAAKLHLAPTAVRREDLFGPPANESGFFDLGVQLTAVLAGAGLAHHPAPPRHSRAGAGRGGRCRASGWRAAKRGTPAHPR
jgi:hypothetical protein